VAVAKGQTTPARGVSRFLAAHEACASGFQITRTGEAGRPRLRLLCQGCGQRAAYAAGDAGLLGEEVEVKPSSEAGESTPAPKRFRRRFAPTSAPVAPSAAGPAPAQSPAPPKRPVPPESPAPPASKLEGWLPAPAALPWWVPNVYILVVIAAGIGLIAFGVIHEQNGGGNEGSAFEPPQSTQTAPAPQEQPAPSAVPSAARPAQGVPTAPSAAALRRAKKKLDPVEVLGRFTVGVPEGWSQGTSGGAVVFRPDDGEAEVRVFLQPGAEPLNRLERDAARFLRQERDKVAVSDPESLRFGPTKARELRARYDGGTETAVVLAADGYSYLLLGQVDSKTPPSLDALTVAALRSFRAS
jgi:hypothetical protein